MESGTALTDGMGPDLGGDGCVDGAGAAVAMGGEAMPGLMGTGVGAPGRSLHKIELAPVGGLRIARKIWGTRNLDSWWDGFLYEID